MARTYKKRKKVIERVPTGMHLSNRSSKLSDVSEGKTFRFIGRTQKYRMYKITKGGVHYKKVGGKTIYSVRWADAAKKYVSFYFRPAGKKSTGRRKSKRNYKTIQGAQKRYETNKQQKEYWSDLVKNATEILDGSLEELRKDDIFYFGANNYGILPYDVFRYEDFNERTQKHAIYNGRTRETKLMHATLVKNKNIKVIDPIF